MLVDKNSIPDGDASELQFVASLFLCYCLSLVSVQILSFVTTGMPRSSGQFFWEYRHHCGIIIVIINMTFYL